MQKLLIYSLIVLLTGNATFSRADESLATPEQTAFFEQKIRPLLIERCYKCHSDEKQVKGGLRLDSRAGWQTGGDSGPAVIPGKATESLLVKAVRYSDQDLKMPPAGKLADAEIALLEEWVKIGAPDPRDQLVTTSGVNNDQLAASKHWAYQPLQIVSPPVVSDEAWCLNDVDRFILAKLEEKGLRQSPDADRYSWLRRVSLDLTGLPPTPEDIQSFVSDHSDQAYENVVDRLIASPVSVNGGAARGSISWGTPTRSVRRTTCPLKTPGAIATMSFAQ